MGYNFQDNTTKRLWFPSWVLSPFLLDFFSLGKSDAMLWGSPVERSIWQGTEAPNKLVSELWNESFEVCQQIWKWVWKWIFTRQTHDNCISGQPLDCSLMRDSKPKALSKVVSRFMIHRQYYFQLLNFGMICYTAINNWHRKNTKEKWPKLSEYDENYKPTDPRKSVDSKHKNSDENHIKAYHNQITLNQWWWEDLKTSSEKRHTKMRMLANFLLEKNMSKRIVE